MADMTISDFDRALLVLGQFAHREGHSRVPRRHIESFQGHEVKLGLWISRLRNDFRQGKLLPERIAAIEAVPGWVWDVLEADFQEGRDALAQFVEREGHARVPMRHVEPFEGREFKLGSWIENRSEDLQAGRLSVEQIAALQVGPGWTWNLRASARRALYPGEATAFARAGISPEEALRWIDAGLNAHQALDAARQGQTLEQHQESKAVRPPTVGLRADRDLAFIRRNLAVTTGEIAFLAGKEPSAVNHWRKGKKNFPEPVVGGRSPLFNLDEVHDWLDLHGKLVNEPAASWLWRKSVQALHQSTGEEDRSRLRGYVSAMVVVLPDFLDDISGFVEIGETGGFDQWCEDPARDLDDELVKFLHKHLVGMDPEYETSRCAARAFRYARDHGFTECGLLDEALDALAEFSATQTTTSLPITGLITSLVGNLPKAPQSVLDLACGEATLITDFLNRSQLPDLKLRGVEKDPDTAAIARIRLQFHDPTYYDDWDIRVGDSLNGAAPPETFDAIVVDPPTKRSKDWVTFARSNLTSDSNSRAFVLLPGSALKADGPCTALIKRKHLEAVVLLPNRLKREARGLALCVFTSDQVTCEEILIIDLSNLKLKNLNYGTVTPTASHNGVDLPVADLCAAISHWRNNRTIDESLLPLFQRSITSDEAVEQDLNHVFDDEPLPILPLLAAMASPKERTPRHRRPSAEDSFHPASQRESTTPEATEGLPLDLREFSEERLEDVRRAFTDLMERAIRVGFRQPTSRQASLFEDDPGTQARLSEDLQLLTKLTAQAFELVGLKARDWDGELEQLMKTRPRT